MDLVDLHKDLDLSIETILSNYSLLDIYINPSYGDRSSLSSLANVYRALSAGNVYKAPSASPLPGLQSSLSILSPRGVNDSSLPPPSSLSSGSYSEGISQRQNEEAKETILETIFVNTEDNNLHQNRSRASSDPRPASPAFFAICAKDSIYPTGKTALYNSANIIQNSRQRKPSRKAVDSELTGSSQRQYIAYISAYNSMYYTVTTDAIRKMHKRDLPPTPRN
ncbi:hypothetical protein CT0861_13211 [Colletotrichum tofieldiae]|uniref:Uncharacterized protein n=1 Tax=Colletotrichum tofieldiae TaxID=708197 RepID=A0A161VPV3_9PEZI|nr:hypothetical protein CT0861_13211 [Colletotrichum tofieldiae]